MYLGVALPSDTVWKDLSKHFDYKMSAAALHVFVKCNRGGILTILGLNEDKVIINKSDYVVNDTQNNDCMYRIINLIIFNNKNNK